MSIGAFGYPPGSPLGTVPLSFVLTSTDWQYNIRQVIQAPNFGDGTPGSGGGTYAPAAPVNVGGLGFALYGTAHQLAANARLTVQPNAELRLPDTASTSVIPKLTLAGSNGSITLSVSGHTSILEIGSGAVERVLTGGSVDVYGQLSLKAAGGGQGPGQLTVETGATTTWVSGSNAIMGGSLAVNGPIEINGIFVFGATSDTHFTNGATWTGIVGGDLTRTGKVSLSGTGARTVHRPMTVLSASGDADITVGQDNSRIPQTLTGNRVYTLRHTGTVPAAGERRKVFRAGTSTPSTHSAKIQREDNTILFTFGGDARQGFAEFEYDGIDWLLIAGAQFQSGTSGYYDDAW